MKYLLFLLASLLPLPLRAFDGAVTLHLVNPSSNAVTVVFRSAINQTPGVNNWIGRGSMILQPGQTQTQYHAFNWAPNPAGTSYDFMALTVGSPDVVHFHGHWLRSAQVNAESTVTVSAPEPVQPKLVPIWGRVRQPDGSYVRKIVAFKKIP